MKLPKLTRPISNVFSGPSQSFWDRISHNGWTHMSAVGYGVPSVGHHTLRRLLNNPASRIVLGYDPRDSAPVMVGIPCEVRAVAACHAKLLLLHQPNKIAAYFTTGNLESGTWDNIYLELYPDQVPAAVKLFEHFWKRGKKCSTMNLDGLPLTSKLLI